MHQRRKLLLIWLLLLCLLPGLVLGESYQTLRQGDAGSAVTAMKQRLYELGYYASDDFNAYYTDNTVQKVKQVQQMNGLRQTGVASSAFLELLFSDDCIRADGTRAGGALSPQAENTAEPAETPAANGLLTAVTDVPTKAPETPVPTTTVQPEVVFTRVLRDGCTGDDVVAMKQRLYDLGYYTTTTLNAYYNDNTVQKVKQAQQLNGLSANGVASFEFLQLLYSEDCICADGTRAGEKGLSAPAAAFVTPVPTATPKPTKTPRPTATPSPTPSPTPEPTPLPTIHPEDLRLPERDAEGYLPQGAEEFVYKNETEGLWMYLSQTLQVTISRYTDTVNRVQWYETHVYTREGELMRAPHVPYAKSALIRPALMAQKNQAVLAITDDFYSYRARAGWRVGTVIRDGEILFDNPKNKGSTGFPQQEALAYFPNGTLKCFDVQEHTAQEYLDMGALHVFAFGPILVTDGQLGEHIYDKNFYHFREPRNAIGMIEPGHFVILTVKGRVDASRGVYFEWLAERMLALGAQEAFNLDGGGTAVLIFMGDVLNYSSNNTRAVGSIIAFGQSDQVQVH